MNPKAADSIPHTSFAHTHATESQRAESNAKTLNATESSAEGQSAPLMLAKPPIEEVCDFLCAYSSALLRNGAYTSRVIKCTDRIAKNFGYDVYLSVFLKYITLNITDTHNYNNRRTQVIKNTSMGVNLALLSDLSALSWQIYDEKLSLKEAREHYEFISAQKRLPSVLGAILIPLGNATFCKLFDGDFGALICIFMGTFVGFFVRQFFTRIQLDKRAELLFLSFIVSFVTFLGVSLGLSKTPDVAIGGSVLYLIPGALILNAFVDIIHENTLMGISRLINMMVSMICITAGVYLTLAIANMSILNA